MTPPRRRASPPFHEHGVPLWRVFARAVLEIAAAGLLLVALVVGAAWLSTRAPALWAWALRLAAVGAGLALARVTRRQLARWRGERARRRAAGAALAAELRAALDGTWQPTRHVDGPLANAYLRPPSVDGDRVVVQAAWLSSRAEVPLADAEAFLRREAKRTGGALRYEGPTGQAEPELGWFVTLPRRTLRDERPDWPTPRGAVRSGGATACPGQGRDGSRRGAGLGPGRGPRAGGSACLHHALRATP
ncbi:MAG TPA: hypothetical protein VFS43_15560 [Polyangiaceae bacterium]|nr:hypothetical protein [Polyangiaceae bacterium]